MTTSPCSDRSDGENITEILSPAGQSHWESVQWRLRPHICSNPTGHRNTQVALLNIVAQLSDFYSHTGHCPSCTLITKRVDKERFVKVTGKD